MKRYLASIWIGAFVVHIATAPCQGAYSVRNAIRTRSQKRASIPKASLKIPSSLLGTALTPVSAVKTLVQPARSPVQGVASVSAPLGRAPVTLREGGPVAVAPVSGQINSKPAGAEAAFPMDPFVAGPLAGGAPLDNPSAGHKGSKRKSDAPSARESLGTMGALDGLLAGRRFDGGGLPGFEPVVGRSQGTRRPLWVLAAAKDSEAGTEPPSLPPSPGENYNHFLNSLAMQAVGQAILSVFLPVGSLEGGNLLFTVGVQIAQLAMYIPGSAAARFALNHITPQRYYIAAIGLLGTSFLTIPLSMMQYGMINPIHFVALSMISGFVYGSLRAGAEPAMQSALLGQDEKRLQHAASDFYRVVAPAYAAASLSTKWLLDYASSDLLGIIGGVFLLGSLWPLTRIVLGGSTGANTPAKEIRSDPGLRSNRLSPGAYSPYVFFWIVHLLFFALIAPLVAAQIFGYGSWTGLLTGLYAIGNLLPASLRWLGKDAGESWWRSLAPIRALGWVGRLIVKVPNEAWTKFALIGVGMFFGGILISGSPWVALPLAFIMGFGATESMARWQARYQNKLYREHHERIFLRLSVAYTLGTLALMGMMYMLLMHGIPAVWTLGSAGAVLAVFAGYVWWSIRDTGAGQGTRDLK